MPRKNKPILSKRDRELFAPWQQEAIIKAVKKIRELDKKK